MKKLFALLMLIFSFATFAAGMSDAELAEVIKQKNPETSDETISEIISALRDTEKSQNLEVTGVIYFNGFNAACFYDSDKVIADATVRDEQGNIVTIPQLYEIQFDNHGIKGELTYKWSFVFTTSDVNVKSMDNAVYGLGFGLDIDAVVGVEVSIMPGENAPGALIQVAPKVGLGGGIHFPRMSFTRLID